MAYEVVIGLEIHAELSTAGKLFTWTANQFGGEPNSRIDPITLGMPGVLPVLNRTAVDYTMRAGLAMHCDIQAYSKFDRKHYFYPDLPKGYQISQKDLPIALGGHVDYDLDGSTRRCQLTRIHLEEDAGKSIHAEGRADVSWVDYNRACVPLIEIVGEPDLRSPAEAIAYWRAVKEILEFAGVSDCNMEEGSFRCDANISLRREGAEEYGTRAELKNMNSFRNVQRALEFEMKRQAKVLDSGGSVDQETRLFDVDTGTTRAMRSKEEASDYRYFPEPDLVPLVIDDAWIAEVKASVPEAPRDRRRRLIDALGVPEQAAIVLTGTRAMAEFFEAVADGCGDAVLAANWVQGDFLGYLRDAGKGLDDSPVDAAGLAELLVLLKDDTISGRIGKTVLEEMIATGSSAKAIVEAKGLVQVTDASAIDDWIRQAIEENPGPAEDFRGGTAKALGFLVGQVMKLSRGKANPRMVNELLRKALS
jgi:aspartyl-tRNA(Asn)/glutamyl-tRNA(Gln) amidotransferase subunit B